jgi:ATP-dependent DNA helicase RecQ
MPSIIFIDTEIDPSTSRILDIGALKENGEYFHQNSLTGLTVFLNGADFICGHNILMHDVKYLQKELEAAQINPLHIIDTLYLSPLLFPKKPYHKLLKDDKLQPDEYNNPLNDCIKAKSLFEDEVAAFKQLDDPLKSIFYLLLKDSTAFSAFFSMLNFTLNESNPELLIRKHFATDICNHSNLSKYIAASPVELAYCLALINCRNKYSITPPWIRKNFPMVEQILLQLRHKPCVTGCRYCNKALDIYAGLKNFFGFDTYRTYGGEPLQEKAVKAAVDNKSLLAVFPTGGGKSATFQVPALMSGETVKGLTVVISPLQSLMKDQVDNLYRSGITDAATINGLLDPIERSKAMESVLDGTASLLYISPESLRSKTIEHLLLNRNIVRFVIDEAHCFSAWGQDFRVDYLYIADFIKSLQQKKSLEDPIPVSCFTATAKPNVIEDIRAYFRDKLSLELELFSTTASRTNLQYKVYEKNSKEEKYIATRDLLEEKNCPTIIYVSRTKNAYHLAERLTADGFNAKPYHGKMEVKEKTANQNAFMAGDVSIMVATSAFGMGVDKKNVGLVIHYDISDSLENYIQEAGRAGRDEKIKADCFVLFNEDDLGKHFILLNQTKLDISEIKQVWNAIKYLSKFRSKFSNSALEIARKAGWTEDKREIETRVKTAIAALEEAKYVQRGHNMPKVFADSILSKTANEAAEKINKSERFIDEKQKTNGIRIIKKLLSSKNRKRVSEDSAESRVDYIADQLGIPREEVITIINLLREENILSDSKDLTAFIKKGENKNKSLAIFETFSQLENFLMPLFEAQEKIFHLKEINGQAEEKGIKGISPNRIKTIFNFWATKKWIKQQHHSYSKNHVIAILCLPEVELQQKISTRQDLSRFILNYLYDKSNKATDAEGSTKEEILVEFSVLELKQAYEKQQQLFISAVKADDIEDALFYLSRIEAIKIEGGFLVVYNKLTVERLEENSKIQYKIEDYQKLNQFYENKVQQIHIVGEYAKKMIDDNSGARNFVEDYFQLNYLSFLNKYFPGSRQNEIKRNLTPKKYRELFQSLSEAQRKIIDDRTSPYIVVAAGPGSGKTKLLVHKLASLLLMEDVKTEQLLMVTFSRASVNEFKKRLLALIGNTANYVEIKTFHSFCFDLLGKVGNLDKSDTILPETIEKIKNNEVELSRITKKVLVIDEAQDMDAKEFELIRVLMDKNDDMRVIAVGDDDQNIYGFRGADSKYMQQFISVFGGKKYELATNYRSKQNLINFTNQFVTTITNRLKEQPIVAHQTDNGKISIIKYSSKNLITQLIEDVLHAELTGTTCVLTQTNEEAFQITGLLLKNGMHAKLVQSNEGFRLSAIREIRTFIKAITPDQGVFHIPDDLWEKAKREWIRENQNSSKFEICLNIIRVFEITHPKKKYLSDFTNHLNESKLEDFYNETGEAIYVSTIHKAKGKEYDNVILLLDQFESQTDEKRRQLYVAMTRAKNNLTIHLNGNYLDSLTAPALKRSENTAEFNEPRELVIYLTHSDVKLGYFEFVQSRIAGLKSGDELALAEEGLLNQGKLILKFSKSFINDLSARKSKGYRLTAAKVNFIVFWQDKEKLKAECEIVLPVVYMERG